MLHSESYTVPQIVEELDNWGYKTRKTGKRGNTPLGRSTLFYLFQNPFYAGYYLDKNLRYEGAHEAMVTEDEFAKVQKILHKENHIQPQKKEFPFTGFIRCGICGCLVTAEERTKFYPKTGNKRVYRYYHCSGSKGCTKQSVSEEYLENKIEKVLEECTMHPGLTQWLLKVSKRHHKEKVWPEFKILESQHNAVLNGQIRVDKLFDMRSDGEITAQEFIERKKKALLEVDTLKAEVKKTEIAIDRIQSETEKVLNFSETAYQRFTKDDIKAKREVALKLGVSYLLTQGELTIIPNPYLDKIRTFEPVGISSYKEKDTIKDVDSFSWYRREDSNLHALRH